MLVKAYGSAVCGIEAITVTVEVDVSPGINFYLVGLPDSAVRESQQRISTAVQTVGLRIPGRRIVVNMAPADIRKEGSAYDLPIALGILAAGAQISAPLLPECICMGELALDGTLRAIRGALSIALHARESGYKACIFPLESAYEAVHLEGIKIYGVTHLEQVIRIVEGSDTVAPLATASLSTFAEDRDGPSAVPDFSQVCGQEQAKRALEVAAAGGHNVLLSGPPGAGKSFMAKCIPGILPPLSKDEAVETTRIYSVAGQLVGHKGLIRRRPFRAPHHTASAIALIGGGVNALPGEISLAHNGVLYMDELPEFPRSSLEVLRQPLEDGQIQLSRAKYRVLYPARFMLVASMNPCPCGFYGHPTRKCTCTELQINRYRGRLSGPLLDRIDICLNVDPVPVERLFASDRSSSGGSVPEDSAHIRERVAVARLLQSRRFENVERVHCNAQMLPVHIARFCALAPAEQCFLKQALMRLQLSARAHHRVLRMARTIADLDNDSVIRIKHLAEALQYR